MITMLNMKRTAQQRSINLIKKFKNNRVIRNQKSFKNLNKREMYLKKLKFRKLKDQSQIYFLRTSQIKWFLMVIKMKESNKINYQQLDKKFRIKISLKILVSQNPNKN